MKKYLLFVTMLVLVTAVVVFAKGNRWNATIIADCHLATTNTAETVQLNGYLESFYIDVAAGSTQVVTIATTNETLLTVTLSTDATYRPRIEACTVAGASLGGTNDYERFLLCSEKLRITVTSTSTATNDVSVTPTTDID